MSSTSLSPYHSEGRTRASSQGCSPRRYSFESGGRSYGGSPSAPIRTRRPSKPSSRSDHAAVAPHREAPTITKVLPPDISLHAHLKLAPLVAHVEGRDGLGGRPVHDRPRPHVELAAVAFALDDSSVDLAARGEVALPVGADVAEGEHRSSGTRDRDELVAHLERPR